MSPQWGGISGSFLGCALTTGAHCPHPPALTAYGEALYARMAERRKKDDEARARAMQGRSVPPGYPPLPEKPGWRISSRGEVYCGHSRRVPCSHCGKVYVQAGRDRCSACRWAEARIVRFLDKEVLR